MVMIRRQFLPMLAGLSLLAPAVAEVPELVTDRPDQTESSKVVSPGRVQIETGLAFSRNEGGGVREDTTEFGVTLARVGLVERWELRVGWSGFVEEDVRLPGPDVDLDGIGDTSLGAKFHIGEERGRLPEIALLVDSTLPTGANDVSSDRFDPSFRVAASHTLSDRLGVGYNVGIVWSTEEDGGGGRDTLSSFLYTAALGGALSDRAGAFVELFGEVAASASGGPSHSVDGGVTYLLYENLQLDVSGGVGLSDAADDWFVGVGASLRLPD
jgi:hypothetical protein